MPFLSEIRAFAGKPVRSEQPLATQLQSIRQLVSPRPPVAAVADWLRDNANRFAMFEAGPPQRGGELIYRLLSAPDDGSVVGIVLWSEYRYASVGAHLVFTRAFDDEIAAAAGRRPKELRQELRAAGFLRCERDRLTCSIPAKLAAMVPSYAGSSSRRAVGVEDRIMIEHP